MENMKGKLYQRTTEFKTNGCFIIILAILILAAIVISKGWDDSRLGNLENRVEQLEADHE